MHLDPLSRAPHPLITPNRNKLVFNVPALLVAALVFAVFSRSLHLPFIWDDLFVFNEFPGFHGLGWDNIKWGLTKFGIGPYMPLYWISQSVDYFLWGDNTFGYHLTNSLLHSANAVLLYFLVLRLFALPRTFHSERRNSTEIVVAAAVSALFFALHPLRVEAVSQVVGRNDLLMTLFFQLACMTYTITRQPGSPPASWNRRQSLPLFFFILSLLSKGPTVTLPLILLLLDIYPLRRLETDPRRWLAKDNRSVLIEKIPYFTLSLLFGAITIASHAKAKALIPYEQFDLGMRVAQALYALVFYPHKTVLPTDLLPFYGAKPGFGLFTWDSLLNAAGLFAATTAAWKVRKSYPVVTAVWTYYLLTVWPMVGLIKNRDYLAADRYSYYVCLGFAVLAGSGVLIILRSEKGTWRSFRLACAGILLMILAALTWKQQGYWRDSESLLGHAVAVEPEIARTRFHFGNTLFDLGRTKEAVTEYRKAVHLKPDFTVAHYQLGLTLAALGRIDEAVAEYHTAIQLEPNSPNTYIGLAEVLVKSGKSAEAITYSRKALSIKPDSAKAHNDLGVALLDLDRYEEAIEQFREALRIDPAYYEAHNNWGVALYDLKKNEEAVVHYRQALRIKPDHYGAHSNLAFALDALGRAKEAILQYKEALLIQPDNAQSRNNLALLLAKTGRRDEAITQYRELRRIAPAFQPVYFDIDMILTSGAIPQNILHEPPIIDTSTIIFSQPHTEK